MRHPTSWRPFCLACSLVMFEKLKRIGVLFKSAKREDIPEIADLASRTFDDSKILIAKKTVKLFDTLNLVM